MISPTDLGIRNDSEGLGHYGATRTGGHHHKGTDYLAVAGQTIRAPFDMILSRYSKPSNKFPLESGIKWVTPVGSGRMWYFVPIPKLIGTFVPKDLVIGVAIDLKTYYGPKIDCHVHFQINSVDPEIFRSITTTINRYQIF